MISRGPQALQLTAETETVIRVSSLLPHTIVSVDVMTADSRELMSGRKEKYVSALGQSPEEIALNGNSPLATLVEKFQ